MTEGKKILDFLSANGITTLDQLKCIIRHCQNKTVDEEVVFVKEIKQDKATVISQEKLNLLIEASARNKEILLNDLSKNCTGTSNPRPASRQIANVEVPDRSVVNAGCTPKNVNSLPMRYRHKHTHQNHPYQHEIRQQQRERYRQACTGNAHQENIQYHHQQHNNHVHTQNRSYEGAGQNTGYNNRSGYNNANAYNNENTYNHSSNQTMATWPCGGGIINTIAQAIPAAQPVVSTPVYNMVQQHQWPTATSMAAHTGESGYHNNAQFHMTPQTSQQPGTQYIVGSRPNYNSN